MQDNDSIVKATKSGQIIECSNEKVLELLDN